MSIEIAKPEHVVCWGWREVVKVLSKRCCIVVVLAVIVYVE